MLQIGFFLGKDTFHLKFCAPILIKLDIDLNFSLIYSLCLNLMINNCLQNKTYSLVFSRYLGPFL